MQYKTNAWHPPGVFLFANNAAYYTPIYTDCTIYTIDNQIDKLY